MDKLRFGIIGVGARGICNAKAVNAREDVELVGVCDINPARFQVCDEMGIAGERFLDYRELLDRGLDAVCINTDNNVHAEQTIAAAERGINVYCEKPIALNVADAEAMVEACSGLATVVNLSMRMFPVMKLLRRLVEDETWGRLLAVGAVHPKPVGLLSQGQGHRASQHMDVWGPILMHDGVHICEWLRFMGGEVLSVYASTRSTSSDPANEELISAVTEHEDGVLGSLSYMTMPFLPTQQYVICEQASAWPERNGDETFIHVARVGADDERVPVPTPALTWDDAYVDDFVRAIREGYRPYATMEDGLAGQRIVDAIRRSGLEYLPVTLR